MLISPFQSNQNIPGRTPANAFITASTTIPMMPVRIHGIVVVAMQSLVSSPLYVDGNQKVTSVGNVAAFAPRQTERPAMTGDIPAATQTGPAMAMDVSIAAVAEPTAARMQNASKKPSRITGSFVADMIVTRSELMLVALSIVAKHPPAPTIRRILPVLSAASSTYCMTVLSGIYL